jgi:hypothetical protein
MSPFHDLDRRRSGSLPAERERSLAFSGLMSAAGARPGANSELQVISLSRLAGLLSLGVLGLVALLSLGVGGVALVQGYVFRASEVGIREPVGPSRHAETSSSRANARRGSNSSARAAAGDLTAEVLGNHGGARLQRWADRSGPDPRRPESISKNQPETLETAYVETAAGLR